jgi:hypothetical protein
VVETRVRRTREQSRRSIQDALRAECRLALRTREEAQDNNPGAQIPVEVSPGHPASLKELEFPDDFERILLLGRFCNLLEQARTGASGLVKLRDELLRMPEPQKWVLADEIHLRSTADWATALISVLDQQDPLKKVLGVWEDVLGVYEYDIEFADQISVNRASVRLYWGVIGLVSEWLGCAPEDLTIVVLAHELSHAFTQLGADIDGRRWPAQAFANAEVGLKEGLAQYYTDRILNRLERRWRAGRLRGDAPRAIRTVSRPPRMGEGFFARS